MEERDLTGFIADCVKRVFESRTGRIVLAAAAAVVAGVIALAVFLSGRKVPEFETPSAIASEFPGGVQTPVKFTENGVTFSARVSDICSGDGETAELKTDLGWSGDTVRSGGKPDKKFIFIDFIVRNNSSDDLVLNADGSAENSLCLEYLENGSELKDGEDAYFSVGELCADGSREPSGEEKLTVKKGETKEFTLRYEALSEYINKFDKFCIFNPWENVPSGEASKYDIMGVGRLVWEHEFKNSELFPQMMIFSPETGGATEPPPAETEFTGTEAFRAEKYAAVEIPADSPAFYSINTEDNPWELSVRISAAGNAKEELYADISGYSAFIGNESIVGVIPELFYDSGHAVEKVRIEFKIKDEAVQNTSGKYAASNPEFEGIKRFNIFKYFEDEKMQLPIETKFDLDNNIVYAETDSLGTYSLVDMELWFEMLGVEPE